MREPPFGCDDRLQMRGTLEGPDDVDWFTFPAGDTVFGGCDHRAVLDVADARVCIFADCALANVPFASFCVEGDRATGPNGEAGCCASQASSSLQIECTSAGAQLIDVLLRVDQGTASCLHYGLEYRAAISE